MRRRYLVAYDVSDAKRLRRVFRAMNGFGDAVQYSVFLCDLSPSERELLTEKLSQLLHLRDDRALIVDLGLVGSASLALDVLGRQLDVMPEEYRAFIV